MKRTFIIVGVMCIIAGAVSCLSGFAAAGWNASALDPVPAEFHTYNDANLAEGQSFDDIKAVSLTAAGRVQVTRGDAFEVEYATCEYFDYDFAYEDGRFTMTYREKKNYAVHFDLFGVGRKKFAVSVTLPETAEVDLTAETDNSSVYVDGGTYGELHIKTENGRVQIGDLTARTVIAESGNASMHLDDIEADSIRVTTTNGSMDVNACRAAVAILDNKNGSLDVCGGKFGTLDAKTTNASVYAEEVEVEGLLKLGSTNGRVQIENVTAGDVETKTTNSSVRLYDVSAASITAGSTNGSIRTEGIAAKVITLTTTNGSIKGSIRGKASDYTVTSATDGSNNLPSGGHGDGKLTVTTTNGSIRLDFLDA